MKPAIANAAETAALGRLARHSEPVTRDVLRGRSGTDRSRSAETAKIGVIYNPRSAANLGQAPLRAVGVPCGQPANRAELRALLREFAAAEVDVVTVSGGDGTIREVLTAIPEAYGDAPHPAIAILAAGRTDLIASEVGSSGRRDELARLLAAAKAGTLRRTRRPVMRVEGVADLDGEAITPRGMLLGWGAMVFGTELCQKEVHADGASHDTAVGITFARVVGRILFRGDPDRLLKGHRLGLHADGQPDRLGPDGARALLIVSTLREKLVLGRTVFFGDYREDQLQYLETDAPARGLVRAVGSLAIGKPWLAGPGWSSHAANTLELVTDRTIVIDGELFRPIDGRILITADPAVDFVAP